MQRSFTGESHSPVVHELWVLVVVGSNPTSPTRRLSPTRERRRKPRERRGPGARDVPRSDAAQRDERESRRPVSRTAVRSSAAPGQRDDAGVQSPFALRNGTPSRSSFRCSRSWSSALSRPTVRPLPWPGRTRGSPRTSRSSRPFAFRQLANCQPSSQTATGPYATIPAWLAPLEGVGRREKFARGRDF